MGKASRRKKERGWVRKQAQLVVSVDEAKFGQDLTVESVWTPELPSMDQILSNIPGYEPPPLPPPPIRYQFPQPEPQPENLIYGPEDKVR